MFGPATPKLAGVVSTTALLVALVVLVIPEGSAHAAYPGRNGALLLWGTTKEVKCGDPPARLVGRVADDYDGGCEDAPDEPTAWFVLLPGERRLRVVDGPRRQLCFLGTCVSAGASLHASFDRTGKRLWSGVDAWSPGGTRTVSFDYPDRVLVQDASTGRTITSRRGEDPDWSITNKIVYSRYPRLYIMDARGQNPTPVPLPNGPHTSYEATPGDLSAREPEWSPDGQWIAFASTVTTRTKKNGSYVTSSAISAVRPDGTGLRRIVTGVYASDIVWSPDGTRIAYVKDQTVYVAPAVGTAPIRHSAKRALVHYAFVLDWQPLATGIQR